jgi:type I restriction enzyme S subunit
VSKWEKVKLGQIGEFKSGGTPPRSRPEYFEGDIPWITTVSLGKIFIDERDAVEHITAHAVANSATKIISKNSILVGIRVGVGKVSINSVSMCTNQDIISIENIDENKIYKPYLVHSIKSYKQYFEDQKRGATIQGINSGMLKSLNIPLPPLDTQKQIAKTIDTAAELLSMRKRHLAELDNLIKSAFHDMFGDPVANDKGWEVRKLKDLSQLITKGSSPTWQGINYTDDTSQVLFVTSENVREGYLDFSKRKYLEDRFNKIQSRSILEFGDLLINIVGASIGRAAVFYSNEQANINQAVALVRCNNDVCLTYLVHYFNSPKALQQYGEMQVDVARANLSLKNIGDLAVLFPPLSLQNQFATIVTKIEEQKSLVKKAIDETQYLFESLISEYFE